LGTLSVNSCIDKADFPTKFDFALDVATLVSNSLSSLPCPSRPTQCILYPMLSYYPYHAILLSAIQLSRYPYPAIYI
jgi:hypothetical protein